MTAPSSGSVASSFDADFQTTRDFAPNGRPGHVARDIYRTIARTPRHRGARRCLVAAERHSDPAVGGHSSRHRPMRGGRGWSPDTPASIGALRWRSSPCWGWASPSQGRTPAYGAESASAATNERLLPSRTQKPTIHSRPDRECFPNLPKHFSPGLIAEPMCGTASTSSLGLRNIGI
jgi:hypothetical protein